MKIAAKHFGLAVEP